MSCGPSRRWTGHDPAAHFLDALDEAAVDAHADDVAAAGAIEAAAQVDAMMEGLRQMTMLKRRPTPPAGGVVRSGRQRRWVRR